ncbi:mevalonate kinase [Lentilactobacillus sp. Marseille-Q4993]|uniref:mevalonate kinase n=1 Tax=Lentilactobacillus sp. Marseille-Q4993 TaxID=3039492 RepID=UPI0024BC7742|nr:mevalonate kinase [Lentilactobacillus sp. Marseille-Q4993]
MTKKVISKSYAKIILFGEHSVVYGQPAIALPLYSVDVHAEISLEPSGQTLSSRYYEGPIADMSNNLLGVKTLIDHILNELGKSSANFKMTITSQIPSERGMGSSAATAIAITRALYQYFDVPLNREKLLKEALIEEKITHGNPSGIDTATASSHFPIWFIKHKENAQITFNLADYNLVIADSGIKGKTADAVSLIARNMVDDSDNTKPLIDDLGRIATEAKRAIITGDGSKIGDLMYQSQQRLHDLGVSTPTLDKLVSTSKKAGALGAKLTGSGLGGCMIALTDSTTTAQRLATELRKAGATQTWIQSFKNYGFNGEKQNDNVVQ